LNYLLAQCSPLRARPPHILDIQLVASGFDEITAEALSLLLGSTVLSAAGYAKGRFIRATLHDQVPDAYDATRDEVQTLAPDVTWGSHEEDCLTIFAGLISIEVVEARKRHQNSTQVVSPTKMVESPSHAGLRDAEDERQHAEVSQKRWGAPCARLPGPGPYSTLLNLRNTSLENADCDLVHFR
jgi:hypothetical protein